MAAWGFEEGLARRLKCFHSPPDTSPSAYLTRSPPAVRPSPARRRARLSARPPAPRRHLFPPLALALGVAWGPAGAEAAVGAGAEGCPCGRRAAPRRPARCPG